MKVTNVSLELSDELYDNVVEPLKRSKSFSKIIAVLLQGYLEDEYIRNYTEESLDTMKKASLESISKVIGNMEYTMRKIGLMKETDKSILPNNISNDLSNEKISRLESELESLKAHNSQLEGMLEQAEKAVSLLQGTLDRLSSGIAQGSGVVQNKNVGIVTQQPMPAQLQQPVNIFENPMTTGQVVQQPVQQVQQAFQMQQQVPNQVQQPIQQPIQANQTTSQVTGKDSGKDLMNDVLAGNVLSF